MRWAGMSLVGAREGYSSPSGQRTRARGEGGGNGLSREAGKGKLDAQESSDNRQKRRRC